MTILDQLMAAGLPAIDADPGVTPHFSRPLTPEEGQILEAIMNPAMYEALRAIEDVKAIPNWAMWTEAQAKLWVDNNIGNPLVSGRANLPATLTLTTARAAIIQIISILDAMLIMLWALARMAIALRNRTQLTARD